MKLGIHFANFTLPGGPEALAPILAATARAAEEGGASTFTVMDHFFQMESLATAQDPMLKGYTSLGYRAVARGPGRRGPRPGGGQGRRHRRQHPRGGSPS